MYFISLDPDQLASEKPADLDQHCFLKQDIQALLGMKMVCTIIGNESDCDCECGCEFKFGIVNGAVSSSLGL